MAASTVLELVKARLGISTDVRDAYLTSIIQSVVEELEEQQGIKIDNENIIHTTKQGQQWSNA